MNAQYVHYSIANEHYRGKMSHALLQLLCGYLIFPAWQYWFCRTKPINVFKVTLNPPIVSMKLKKKTNTD